MSSSAVRILVTISEIAPEVGYTSEAIRIWVRRGALSAAWDEARKLWLVDPEEVRRVAKSKQKHIPRPFSP